MKKCYFSQNLYLISKCDTEIIPYVLTWDLIVKKYHKTYIGN